MRYKIISDRKNQDVKLIELMEKAKAEVEPLLLETFAAALEKDEGNKMSVSEARERYEALTNGLPKPKRKSKARAAAAEEEMEDAEEAMEEQGDGDEFMDEDPDSMFVPED